MRKKQNTLDAIVAYIAEHQGATTEEIAIAVGRKKSTVRRYIRELVLAGRVQRIPKWEVLR